jgi:ribosome biogenesis SPOUT family RNA methylase Rps3
MPLYVITDTANHDTRLVDAPNPARALRHVTSQQFGVKAASAALVAKLMGAGIQLETVATESEPETATTEN